MNSKSLKKTDQELQTSLPTPVFLIPVSKTDYIKNFIIVDHIFLKKQ